MLIQVVKAVRCLFCWVIVAYWEIDWWWVESHHMIQCWSLIVRCVTRDSLLLLLSLSILRTPRPRREKYFETDRWNNQCQEMFSAWLRFNPPVALNWICLSEDQWMNQVMHSNGGMKSGLEMAVESRIYLHLNWEGWTPFPLPANLQTLKFKLESILGWNDEFTFQSRPEFVNVDYGIIASKSVNEGFWGIARWWIFIHQLF